MTIGELVPPADVRVGDSIWLPGVGEGNVIGRRGRDTESDAVAVLETDLGDLHVHDGDLIDLIDRGLRGEQLALTIEL